MDNQSLQKIKDIIARSQTVTIAVGANPTVDQMAGALSFYLTFSNLNKKVAVLSPTAPIVELSSLVGIDKVLTSNEGTSGDLVVSFPYREGEIEKVSYTIDDGFLNIVVKAGEQGLTFTEQDVMFKRGADKADLIVTVGVQSMSDIAPLFTEEGLKDTTIINIDNNAQNEGFGDVVLVSAKFSSLSEQIADLLLNLEVDMDIDISQNLLSGITNATSNFQSPQTSYLAFEVAALLMKRGAIRSRQGMPQREEPRRIERPQQQAPQQQRRFVPSQQQQQRPAQQQRQQLSRQNEQVQAPKQNDLQDQRQAQQAQTEQKPPSDWLTPKVYKGSSAV